MSRSCSRRACSREPANDADVARMAVSATAVRNPFAIWVFVTCILAPRRSVVFVRYVRRIYSSRRNAPKALRHNEIFFQKICEAPHNKVRYPVVTTERNSALLRKTGIQFLTRHRCNVACRTAEKICVDSQSLASASGNPDQVAMSPCQSRYRAAVFSALIMWNSTEWAIPIRWIWSRDVGAASVRYTGALES